MRVNGHIATEPSSLLPVCHEKERQLYVGEQSRAFCGEQTRTVLHNHTLFHDAHRLFTHASAPTHCKVRETHTNPAQLGPDARKTRRPGWQEIRAEVSEGWREVQPK